MALPPLKFPIIGEDRSDRAFRSLKGRVEAAKRNFGGIGPIIRGAFAVTAVTSFSAAVGGALGNARQFGKAMSEVETLLPDKSQMAELTKQVNAQSIAFGRAPIGQAKALYQIISAGASSAARATEVLTASNKLAIGGVTEIAIAADGLTTVLNAYGDKVGSATDVSDAMFVAMKAGKTTIGELSGSLGKVAPIAATAGVRLEELLAATASLTKQGISTSESMNGLRAIIAAILKPSSEAEKIAAKLGIQFNAQALAAKGLSGFMAELRQKTGGSVEVMAKLFGGVEALNPALALTGNGARDFAQILQDMGRKAGATDEAFKKMSDNADFHFNRLKAAITVAATAIGAKLLPPLATLAEFVANNLPRGIDRVVEAFKRMRAAVVDTNNDMADFMDVMGGGDFGGITKGAEDAEKAVLKLNAAIDEGRAGGGKIKPAAPLPVAKAKIFETDPMLDAARKFRILEQGKVAALNKTTEGLKRQAAQQRQLTAAMGMGGEVVKKLKSEQDLQNEATRLNIDLTTEQGARWLEAARASQKATQGLDAVKAAQERVAATAREAGNAFGNFAGQLISDSGNARGAVRGLLGDLINLTARKSLIEPLSDLFSDGFGKAFKINPISDGGPGGISGFPGFAHGGQFTVGGGGGTDTTPVNFMATRGERVTVETPGQQRRGGGGGGNTFIFKVDARGADTGVEARVLSALEAVSNSIESRAISAVASDREHGGPTGSPLGG